jgi:hypothetical protein
LDRKRIHLPHGEELSVCEFIELIEARGEQGREFSSKVNALSLGYRRLQRLDYDFLDILDGDKKEFIEFLREEQRQRCAP